MEKQRQRMGCVFCGWGWGVCVCGGGEGSVFSRGNLPLKVKSPPPKQTNKLNFYPPPMIKSLETLEEGGIHLLSTLLPSSLYRYFTQDAPSLLFTSLPLCLLGAWQSPRATLTPFWVAVWNLIVLSCLGHKEHRFLLPVLPIASLYAGESMSFLVATK